MNKVALGLFALALALPPSVTAAQQPANLPEGTRVLTDLAYVQDGHERQKLDLYLPAEGTNWPLIVWIHGGAWRAGSKVQPPALRFLPDGFAIASVNYRLSQHAKFPAQIEDCKAAIRWLRAHAPGHGYDASRIGAWGSSAGGHLVALLGTTGDTKEFDNGSHLDQPSRVQAVVDFFGPTDFLQMNTQSREIGRQNHDAPDSPESVLVGGPIQENKEKTARANPITYVSAGDSPFLIMLAPPSNRASARQARRVRPIFPANPATDGRSRFGSERSHRTESDQCSRGGGVLRGAAHANENS